MTDADAKQLQRRIETLERELGALRQRVGNMPVRPVKVAGAGEGGGENRMELAQLPNAYTHALTYGFVNAPDVYSTQTGGWYRLVKRSTTWHGPDQGHTYYWSALTLPVWYDTLRTPGRVASDLQKGEPFLVRNATEGGASVPGFHMYYNYGYRAISSLAKSIYGAISAAFTSS